MAYFIGLGYLKSHPPCHRDSRTARMLKEVAVHYSVFFRYSRREVPHLVKIGETQAYSIGYFAKARAARFPEGDFWRVLYPYGEVGPQSRRDFSSAEEAFQFIEARENGLSSGRH